jgi:hypothetical protein
MNRHANIDPAAGWLDRLCHLNAATTAQRGRAPHKPLMLLCGRRRSAMSSRGMIEEGAVTVPSISYSPELFFRFSVLLGPGPRPPGLGVSQVWGSGFQDDNFTCQRR